jgi:3-carboxy-cis,cis-muconate cycloisomerase
MSNPPGTSAIDSGLFRDIFGTAEMRAIFYEDALIRTYIDVETALARAEAATGVIPEDAAREVTTHASIDMIDRERLREETLNVGYPILPLVSQLSAKLGDAGRYLHWGATTQDIMDTATVLQIRSALTLVERDLGAVREALVRLSRRYRDTPMAGRTHLQQALPVTFGHKTAVWLSALDRHAERLGQLMSRVLVAEFAGAAGTLASLGVDGLRVHDAFARELGLAPAPIAWHVVRDGLTEAVQFLALTTGTLGKIGYDVMLMASTEVGEVFEPFAHGRGASSTMPQKRNPISSEILVATAKAVAANAGSMLEALIQDHERATGPWHLEWLALPNAFVLAAGSLAQARFMLAGLIVDEARMARNLGLTGGLIVAEAVMMGVAPFLGRQKAHEVVYAACRTAVESDRTLADVLTGTDAVASHLSAEQIRTLTDPANYLGSAAAMVDRVVGERT